MVPSPIWVSRLDDYLLYDSYGFKDFIYLTGNVLLLVYKDR
jgi:hypothetical protein